MTDAELSAIESRAKNAIAGPSWAQDLDLDVTALVADARRLKALIKRAEWRSGGSANTYWVKCCSFCDASTTSGGSPPHADDCPAFDPEGAVK
jgi:hypothetical protein